MPALPVTAHVVSTRDIAGSRRSVSRGCARSGSDPNRVVWRVRWTAAERGLVDPLTPQIHAIGEFGRVGDLLPPLAADLIALTPYDFRVSAFYGEGGVRLLTGSGAFDPYVEATFGVARLSPRFSGFSPRVDAIATATLNLLQRTEPMVGIGGGVLLRGGPVVADIGYRFKQIVGDDTLMNVLSAGTQLRAHQVRFGVGIRF
jgi:hypothetical protein